MRVLIVGSGLVGGGLARRLGTHGAMAILASRRPRIPGPAWLRLDATDPGACLRAVDRARPDAVVLAHGPSDVTWCESNPDDAAAVHATATANLVAASRGARVLLVSTDNVFSGEAPAYLERDPTRPVNAYGRSKLGAERILLDAGDRATVARVSLVYGWQPASAGGWLNYFARCAEQLRRGETVAAPHDHWNTPILIDDAARVLAALLGGGDHPALVHVAGPDRISRYDWASRIAEALGWPASRVIPVPRKESRYACRPVNACLASGHLGDIAGAHGIEIRGVGPALAALVGGKGGGPCTS